MQVLDYDTFQLINEKEFSFRSWTVKDYINWVVNTPVIKAFVLEGKDTKSMLATFSVLLMEKLNIKHRSDIPSKEEIRVAIKQLKSVPKIMPLCGMLLLPIPFMIESYLVLAFLIWKLSGEEINILPSNFKLVMEDLASKKVFRFLNRKPNH